MQFGCCLNISFSVWILWCVMKNSRDNYPQFTSENIKTCKMKLISGILAEVQQQSHGRILCFLFFPTSPVVAGGNFHRFMWEQKRKILLWKCTISVRMYEISCPQCPWMSEEMSSALREFNLFCADWPYVLVEIQRSQRCYGSCKDICNIDIYFCHYFRIYL